MFLEINYWPILNIVCECYILIILRHELWNSFDDSFLRNIPWDWLPGEKLGNTLGGYYWAVFRQHFKRLLTDWFSKRIFGVLTESYAMFLKLNQWPIFRHHPWRLVTDRISDTTFGGKLLSNYIRNSFGSQLRTDC